MVTVQARDDRGNTGTFDVTVTVTDVNEGPEIAETGTNTDITVQEYTDPNQDPALQTLATYTARDPEGSAISRWSCRAATGATSRSAKTVNLPSGMRRTMTVRWTPTGTMNTW